MTATISMLSYQDKNGEWQIAHNDQPDFLDRTRNYVCPECGWPCVARKGSEGRDPHGAHKVGARLQMWECSLLSKEHKALAIAKASAKVQKENTLEAIQSLTDEEKVMMILHQRRYFAQQVGNIREAAKAKQQELKDAIRNKYKEIAEAQRVAAKKAYEDAKQGLHDKEIEEIKAQAYEDAYRKAEKGSEEIFVNKALDRLMHRLSFADDTGAEAITILPQNLQKLIRSLAHKLYEERATAELKREMRRYIQDHSSTHALQVRQQELRNSIERLEKEEREIKQRNYFTLNKLKEIQDNSESIFEDI